MTSNKVINADQKINTKLWKRYICNQIVEKYKYAYSMMHWYHGNKFRFASLSVKDYCLGLLYFF